MASELDLRFQYAEALACIEKRDYQRAASLCQGILQEYPEHRGAWVVFGQAQEGMGRLEIAESAFRQCAVLEGGNPYVIYTHLGRMLVEQERYSEAAVLLRRACEAKPASHRLLFYSVALWHLDRPNEAIRAIEQAIALDPKQDDEETWDKLGRYLWKSDGDRDRAMTALRKALEVNPSYARAWAGLSEMHLEDRNLDEAGQCADQAVRAKEDVGHYHALVAEVRERLGDYTGALAELEKAMLCPDDLLESRLRHAEVLQHAGEFEKAREAYRKMLAGWPDEPHVYRAYLDFIASIGDQEEAEDVRRSLDRTLEFGMKGKDDS